MTAAAEHVTYQLPNEHSCVGYVLDLLQTADTGLNAAMASIETDTTANGMRNDFEQAVTYLLPYDPVLKRRTEKSKRGGAEISSMHADDDDEVRAFGAKKGIGKTGVHLRYHTNKEYQSLNQEQMTELREWRKTPEGQKATTASKMLNPTNDHRNNSNKKTRFNDKALASPVEKRVKERLKVLTQANDDEAKEEARIMSVMKKMKDKGIDISAAMAQSNEAKTVSSSSDSLKSILKKAKKCLYPALLTPMNIFEKEHIAQPDKTFKIITSDHLYFTISTIDASMGDNTDEMSRTDLDLHANMPVVGRHAHVISDTGRTAEVNALTPDYKAMKNVKIVDAAIKYECLYDGKDYILAIRNALHVPSMRNNLIPPFIMREAGDQVYGTPKIKCDGPTEEDHSIYFPETEQQIPLALWGVVSYFSTLRPTADEMMNTDEIYMLTPSRWNPHCDSYATNEENMLEWQGNIFKCKDRAQYLPSDIIKDLMMSSALYISSVEYSTINDILDRAVNQQEDVHPTWMYIPREADEVASVLTSVSPTLDNMMLLNRLTASVEVSKFKACIGSSCNALRDQYLQPDNADIETVVKTTMMPPPARMDMMMTRSSIRYTTVSQAVR